MIKCRTALCLLLGLHISAAGGEVSNTPGTRVMIEMRRSQQLARNTNPALIKEGFISAADGARLFYQKAGSGSRTIVIPGRLFIFDYLKPLADQYTIISYDMRNRGRSDAVSDGSRITIQDDVKDLETVRQHFGLKSINLVGYSYLGLMVVLYAIEHPQQVVRIVQFGPVPLLFPTEYPAHLTASRKDTGADPKSNEKIRKLKDQGYDKSNPKEYCEAAWAVDRYDLVGNPANVGKLREGPCDMPNEWPINFERHLKYHFGSVQKLKSSWENVAKVTQPVLTIHGTKDRNAPYGAGREWALKLPNARLLTIQDGAHETMGEYPEIVLPAMRAFFGAKWPTGTEKVTALDRKQRGS